MVVTLRPSPIQRFTASGDEEGGGGGEEEEEEEEEEHHQQHHQQQQQQAEGPSSSNQQFAARADAMDVGTGADAPAMSSSSRKEGRKWAGEFGESWESHVRLPVPEYHSGYAFDLLLPRDRLLYSAYARHEGKEPDFTNSVVTTRPLKVRVAVL